MTAFAKSAKRHHAAKNVVARDNLSYRKSIKNINIKKELEETDPKKPSGLFLSGHCCQNPPLTQLNSTQLKATLLK